MSDKKNTKAKNTASAATDSKVETALTVVPPETKTSDNTTEAAETPKKNKVKRTLTPTEVAECYGKGGVDSIKSFAAQNSRKLTAGPIEATLKSIQLYLPAEQYNEVFGPLKDFLQYVKDQPGAGKGKKATYKVNGLPSSFKIQRPVNKKTEKVQEPRISIPLTAFMLATGQTHVWVSFTNDSITITPKKPK